MNGRHRAGKVGAVAQLCGVSLRSVDARLVDADTVDAPLELDLGWEINHTRPTPDEVTYDYQLAVSEPSGRFRIECTYELEYDLPSDKEISEEDLVAFGEISVAFSAFPYARELVQSLTTRASLPPLVLGTLRAPIDPPQDSAAADGSAVESTAAAADA